MWWTACAASRYIIGMAPLVWVVLFLATGTSALAQPVARGSAHVPVRPGDRVTVWLFDRPSSGTPWTYLATIDANGQVELPMAGQVRLGGLPASAAHDTVRARLGAYLRPGLGAVLIQRRVIVTGAVQRPDVYYVDATMSIAEAVGLAGGVVEGGNRQRLVLRREGTVREFGHWQVAGTDTVALASGDQVEVPQLAWYRRNALSLLSALGVLGSLVVGLTR
jgi:protein involved in polysaccharide export with SLBB domain